MGDIITSAHYTSVRLSLGFAMADTTNVPDSLVEDRLFLGASERAVQQAVSTWATVIDTGDSSYDAGRHETLRDAVIYAVGARLAAMYFARRAGEEIAKVRLGPHLVDYRTPTEWGTVAHELAERSAAALTAVGNWGDTTTGRVTLTGISGPTRRLDTLDNVFTVADWENMLLPEIVKGTAY